MNEISISETLELCDSILVDYDALPHAPAHILELVAAFRRLAAVHKETDDVINQSGDVVFKTIVPVAMNRHGVKP